MHKRNPHCGRYDFQALSKTTVSLKNYIQTTSSGDMSIDFSDEQAVRTLNKALLAHFYQVENWDIPEHYLCPPIPGRADYIHHLADLLACNNNGKIPTGKKIQLLDIGCGANCIYPILGSQSYGWKFKGTDIDPVSVSTANLIAQSNRVLKKHIEVVQQKNADFIFNGMIKTSDRFDACVCNPPFHASMKEASAGTQKKWKNLNKGDKTKRNFGGQKAELWCAGGEIGFLKRMANESANYAEQVCWFTCLVSKKDNVQSLIRQLKKLPVKQIDVVNMAQGQKVSRFVAWSFLDADQQKSWAQNFWK